MVRTDFGGEMVPAHEWRYSGNLGRVCTCLLVPDFDWFLTHELKFGRSTVTARVTVTMARS
jgi:hypothetical protein